MSKYRHMKLLLSRPFPKDADVRPHTKAAMMHSLLTFAPGFLCGICSTLDGCGNGNNTAKHRNEDGVVVENNNSDIIPSKMKTSSIIHDNNNTINFFDGNNEQRKKDTTTTKTNNNINRGDEPMVFDNSNSPMNLGPVKNDATTTNNNTFTTSTNPTTISKHSNNYSNQDATADTGIFLGGNCKNLPPPEGIENNINVDHKITASHIIESKNDILNNETACSTATVATTHTDCNKTNEDQQKQPNFNTSVPNNISNSTQQSSSSSCLEKKTASVNPFASLISENILARSNNYHILNCTNQLERKHKNILKHSQGKLLANQQTTLSTKESPVQQCSSNYVQKADTDTPAVASTIINEENTTTGLQNIQRCKNESSTISSISSRSMDNNNDKSALIDSDDRIINKSIANVSEEFLPQNHHHSSVLQKHQTNTNSEHNNIIDNVMTQKIPTTTDKTAAPPISSITMSNHETKPFDNVTVSSNAVNIKVSNANDHVNLLISPVNYADPENIKNLDGKSNNIYNSINNNPPLNISQKDPELDTTTPRNNTSSIYQNQNMDLKNQYYSHQRNEIIQNSKLLLSSQQQQETKPPFFEHTHNSTSTRPNEEALCILKPSELVGETDNLDKKLYQSLTSGIFNDRSNVPNKQVQKTTSSSSPSSSSVYPFKSLENTFSTSNYGHNPCISKLADTETQTQQQQHQQCNTGYKDKNVVCADLSSTSYSSSSSSANSNDIASINDTNYINEREKKAPYLNIYTAHPLPNQKHSLLIHPEILST